jgi:O-antigen biosynthesis protein
MFDPVEWRMTYEKPLRLSPTSAWVEHIPFAMALVEMLRPSVLVELGTQRGDSYCAFCQAVTALKLPARCFGIDTWADDPDMPMSAEQMLAELRSYHDPLYGRFSTLVASKFDDALPRFELGQIDLLHIDGMHDYGSVRHDFETWLPKLSRRGVVLFHDTAERGREDFGVWRLWEELSPKFPSFEFGHGHGLGVLAAGDDVPLAVIGFLEWAKQRPDAARALYSTLGNRVNVVRQIQSVILMLGEQRKLIAQWRQMTRQPRGQPLDFTQAIQPLDFAVAAAKEVEGLAQDDLRLREHIVQLKGQLQALQEENHRMHASGGSS